jgi:signal transduction histidine kinase/DNA-binding NarL/FixJ family response regulator/HPt (histidine-containing phosphotransfer) domain-containing protein
MNAMLQRQRYIQQLETRILTEDKQVMDQIRDYVVRLEDYERANALNEAAAAHSNVRETTDKIFLVVILSLLVLLVFSWLFVSGVNRSRYYRRQLLAEKARAEELVEIKQRFMANISHEIRTPLNSIIGFSRQLKKVFTRNKKEEEFIDAINQSSQHLLGIVNDILDFSKIEAGKIRLEIIPVDLNHIINEVYDTLVILAQEKNLSFSTDVSELKQPVVLSDPLRLRQIVLNIASNAIKFTPSGSVTIKISDYLVKNDSRKSQVKIRVTDTGIGITKEDQEKIFEEFAQSDSRVNRRHGGTGLGLSISRKLTELMGGNIELVSQPGEGAVFTIHLPMELCKEDVAATDVSSLTDQDDFKGKILLVDDDRLNRMLIRSLMEMAPQLILHEAESASEALDMLWTEHYDLIITDIQMPGLSGVEMVNELRNQQESPNYATPVLACTADITQETIQNIQHAGIEVFITKPIDEKLLLDKIASMMLSANSKLERIELQKNEPLQVESTSVLSEDKPDGPSSALMDEGIELDIIYDLEGIRSFTGNDDASMASILKTFVEETRQNIGKLERAGVSKDSEEVQSVIHKMSNMMGLLNAHTISLCIRKLKGNGRPDLNDPKAIEHLQNLIRLSHELLEALKKESLLQGA